MWRLAFNFEPGLFFALATGDVDFRGDLKPDRSFTTAANLAGALSFR
jgi:hypothetical protein